MCGWSTRCVVVFEGWFGRGGRRVGGGGVVERCMVERSEVERCVRVLEGSGQGCSGRSLKRTFCDDALNKRGD